MPVGWRELAGFASETVLVVDGYEQLSAWNRFRLGRLCARKGFGLLVTSHETTGLPLVYRFSPDRAAMHAVVEWLLRDRPESTRRITPADVDQAFEACSGSIREALFRLYDVYEARRVSAPQSS